LDSAWGGEHNKGDATRGKDATITMVTTTVPMMTTTEGGGMAAERKGDAVVMINAGCSILIRARVLYTGCSGY
jgi:hypothetical protein